MGKNRFIKSPLTTIGISTPASYTPLFPHSSRRRAVWQLGAQPYPRDFKSILRALEQSVEANASAVSMEQRRRGRLLQLPPFVVCHYFKSFEIRMPSSTSGYLANG
jgi:hypothetical protein